MSSLRVAPALLLASLCWLCAGDWVCDTTPSQRAAIVSKALESLSSEYTVENGLMYFVNGTGFGSNPSSRYGVFTFTERRTPAFQIAANEAIVWLGCTPPPLKYFSFRSYVFTKFNPFALVFASLGDSANHLVYNTTGGASSPFNKTSLLVTGADRAIDKQIRSAFQAAGVSADIMNSDVIPSTLPGIKLGHGLLDDMFTMLYRVALFDDKRVGELYVNTTFPIVRLVKKPTVFKPDPFPIPELRERGTGRSEYAQRLDWEVNALANRINQVYSPIAELISTSMFYPIPIEGFDCIRDNTDCAGDNRDAIYAGPRTGNFSFGARDFFWVIGINHYATGKTVYSNVDVNALTPTGWGGVAAMENFQFAGSAARFNPPPAVSDLLFAIQIARPEQCGSDRFCLSLPESLVRDGAPTYFISRAYLEKETKTAPDPKEIVYEWVQHWRLR